VLVIYGCAVLAEEVIRQTDGSLKALLHVEGGVLDAGGGIADSMIHALTLYADGGIGFDRLPNEKELKAEGIVLTHCEWIALSARIRYRGSDVYAERRWHPKAGNWDQIGGLERSKVPADVDRAHRSFSIMDRLDSLRSGRGRKSGDGITWSGGTAHFLDDLWTTLEKLTQETGTRYGHNPVSQKFRSKMQQATPSANTIRKWLKDVGLLPKHVTSGQVTRANYLEFVGKAPASK
jgi:hypothetical protein